MYQNQSHCVSWPGEARPIKNPGNVGYDCLTRATGRKGEQEENRMINRDKDDVLNNLYNCWCVSGPVDISTMQSLKCTVCPQRPDFNFLSGSLIYIFTILSLLDV